MFTSAELIEALRRRTRRSIRPQAPGTFPPGWEEWLAGMAACPGEVAGAPAGELVAAAAARMPRLPSGIVAGMGRWRAFGILWRQDWEPPSRDERWMRVASTSGSLLLHMLLALALSWLMLHRFHFPPPAADARDGEEHVLQVEYIGEGTPVDAGGGAQDAPTGQDAPPARATAPAVAATRPEPRQVPAQPVVAPGAAPEAVPEPLAAAVPPSVQLRELVVEVPELAPAAVPFPDHVLQVTEVPVPDTTFVVPPPVAVDVRAPDFPRQDIVVRARAIEAAADPVGAPAMSMPRTVGIEAPALPPQGVEVVRREIEVARPASIELRAPAAAAPSISTRERAVEVPGVIERAVPMPAGPARREGAATAAATPSPAAPATGQRPEAGAGTRSAGANAGAGPRPGQPPGALPAAGASDDWGDSTRNQPGRQAGTPGASGLFDADGRPRLAGDGRVGGGLPPGTITEDFENVDRHGTWLKRPPYDYEPTSFDQFWLPSESLLEEWVRKSITEVRIPIPGTTKTIRCVTVLLALGGGCGIEDPNLQEQPTHGRPAPVIPFKRELQEDQESLGPPQGR